MSRCRGDSQHSPSLGRGVGRPQATLALKQGDRNTKSELPQPPDVRESPMRKNLHGRCLLGPNMTCFLYGPKAHVCSGEQYTMRATVPWRPASFFPEPRENGEVIAMGTQKIVSPTETFLRLSFSARELLMFL